jgi:hypothetical protein
MAKKKASDKVGMTPERRSEIDAETAKALESARASEEARRARKTSTSVKGPDRISLEESKAAVKKRSASRPTVKRDESTGKIVSAKPPKAPMTGTPVTVDAKTRILHSKTGTVVAKPRKKTRTGKKLDKATGKIAIPTVKRGEDGKAVAIPKEERVSPVTQLPTAGPDVMAPKGPAAPLAGPRGGVKPNKKNLNNRGNLKGFAVSHKIVAAAANAAMGHLRAMHQTHGTSAFHEHHEVFNLIHANIAKMSPDIHAMLGQGRHEVMNPGPETGKRLNDVEKAVNDRITIGKQAQEARARRQDESRG